MHCFEFLVSSISNENSDYVENEEHHRKANINSERGTSGRADTLEFSGNSGLDEHAQLDKEVKFIEKTHYDVYEYVAVT